MTDYFLGNFPGGGYSPVHKGYSSKYSQPWTPNFEISEGMRFGLNYPAPYLPLVRYEAVFKDYIVISAGKPVALDSDGFMVPAGFKALIAAGGGAGPQYSQLDIDLGILNAQGNVPTVGAYVVDSIIAASKTVGYCAGVASYNAYTLAGSDPTNPGTYKFHNYNRQTGVAILTDYYLEYPVEPLKRTSNTIVTTITSADQGDFDLAHNTVLDYTVEVKINGRRDVDFTFVNGTPDKIDWNSGSSNDHLKVGDKVEVTYLYEEAFYQTPLDGIATWRGTAKPGDYVVVDENSCFKAYSAGTIGDTSAANEATNIAAAIDSTLDIVGQVYKVDTNFPKQFLDRVKTAYDDRLTGPIMDGETGKLRTLDRQPGSATDGMPHNIWLAGGDKYTGIVRFNLNVR
jgi:hypothetical protein